MNDSEWENYLSKIHDTMMDWGRHEIHAVAQRVTTSLAEIRASGIYGNNYDFPSLWEEYCFDLQMGPIDLPAVAGLPSLEEAWDMTVDQHIGFALSDVPAHALPLLSAYGAFDLELDREIDVGAIWEDGLRRVILKELRCIAAMENLNKFI